MVAEASTQSSGTEGTSNVSVIAGDDVETTQATDLDALHLRHRSNQDVGTFILREVHSDQPGGSSACPRKWRPRFRVSRVAYPTSTTDRCATQVKVQNRQDTV